MKNTQILEMSYLLKAAQSMPSMEQLQGLDWNDLAREPTKSPLRQPEPSLGVTNSPARRPFYSGKSEMPEFDYNDPKGFSLTPDILAMIMGGAGALRGDRGIGGRIGGAVGGVGGALGGNILANLLASRYGWDPGMSSMIGTGLGGVAGMEVGRRMGGRKRRDEDRA